MVHTFRFYFNFLKYNVIIIYHDIILFCIIFMVKFLWFLHIVD